MNYIERHNRAEAAMVAAHSVVSLRAHWRATRNPHALRHARRIIDLIVADADALILDAFAEAAATRIESYLTRERQLQRRRVSGVRWKRQLGQPTNGSCVVSRIVGY